MKRFFPFLGISFLIHMAFFLGLNTNTKTKDLKVTDTSQIKVRLKELVIREKDEARKSAKKLAKKSIHRISEKNKNQQTEKLNRTVLNKYILSIYKRVEENKFYPRRAKILKHEGKLEVEILIAQNGEILTSKYLLKSNSKYLNKATLSIFKKIKSFDSLPLEIADAPLKVVIPVTYQL